MRHFLTLTFFASGSNDFRTLARILLSGESASRGVLGVAGFELEALARVAFFEGVAMGEDISILESRNVGEVIGHVQKKRDAESEISSCDEKRGELGQGKRENKVVELSTLFQANPFRQALRNLLCKAYHHMSRHH